MTDLRMLDREMCAEAEAAPAARRCSHPGGCDHALLDDKDVLPCRSPFSDELTCRREVFRWTTRYNTRRRHSWCAQQASNTYETRTAATVQQAA